jgi:hypothetical protein
MTHTPQSEYNLLDTDEIITGKKEAPRNAKKGKKPKERNAPANIAS